MAALPSAYVAHQVGGRTRVRIPGMRRNAAYFEKVERDLGALDGIRAVRVNPVTGSVLIDHSSDFDALKEAAREAQLFDVSSQRYQGPTLSEMIYTRVSPVADGVRAVTGGRVDAAGIGIVALTALGFRQIVNGKALPAGWSMLWHAVSLLRQAKPRAPEPAPLADGGPWATH